ncbi:MAG: hypothetical protein R2809_05780 [Flavobacteriales bacterium]
MKPSTLLRSCEKATFLIEKKMMNEINCVEIFSMYKHLLICKACRRYFNQAPQLNQQISKYVSDQMNSENSEKLKQRIHRSLENLEG